MLVAIFVREKEYTTELLIGIYKNGAINCLGLLFTAIIQTFQEKLDLYHAIVVMYILIFYNVAFLFGKRRFAWSSQTNFQMFLYLLMHASGVIIFFIWFLYVAIDGSKFGSQPSCNHLVNFAFFFANVRATITWFRVMMIVFFAVVIPFFLLYLGFLIFAPAWCSRLPLQKGFDRNPKLVGLVRFVIGILLAVYIIANLELIIHRNSSIIQPGENEWGFGQIIAVILTLGIFIDIVTAIHERHRMKHQLATGNPKNSEDWLTG